MLNRFTAICAMACAMGLILVACSGNSEVTSPEVSPKAQASTGGHALWGLYDVTIDPFSGELEYLPMRTADFTANVVRFLQPPGSPIEMIAMKLKSGESLLSGGLVAIDITIRHPFPGNRYFRGFDVRGIIMLDGGNIGKHDTKVNFPTTTGSRLLNPDGFARWWNMAEFTSFGKIFGYTEGHFATPGFTPVSTVNPYKLFCAGLEPNQPFYQLDPANRATFPAVDGIFTRYYRIQFDPTKTPVFRFKYAVDASWYPPNPAYSPTYPVEAYGPQANCQEAYMVRVRDYEEIPYYVDQWVSGGNIIMNLIIGDWQATGGNLLNEISHVWLESPQLFDDPVDVRSSMQFVESTTPTQATYKITLNDVHPTGLEGQQMLITIESTNPNTFEPQISGGGSGFVYPSSPLAAYLVTDVPVTNLTPEGDYAYVYFLPDWCATMRTQCIVDESGGPSGNQPLMANIMGQDLEGTYNDFTHVQVWEGKSAGTAGQQSSALQATCSSLGYSFARTYNDYFDPTGSRVVIVIGLTIPLGPPDPPYTQAEATAMQNFIANGGILMFMCEASSYFYITGYDELFGWLGMLMQYGGGATPEFTDGYTRNIVQPHFLTGGVDVYHYYTVGQWLTQDPFVLPLIKTEFDEKVVLIYPLPLE